MVAAERAVDAAFVVGARVRGENADRVGGWFVTGRICSVDDVYLHVVSDKSGQTIRVRRGGYMTRICK